MRKIKMIQINYIEENIPLREKVRFEELTKEAQSAFTNFIRVYKQERKGKNSISLTIKDSKRKPEFDVICPIYWVNEHFEDNIANWFKEIPIRKLYLGVNNPNIEIQVFHPKVEVIDQTKHKTLGFCIAELMKQVRSEWFIYIHADAVVCSGLIPKLKRLRKSNVGIIESDRWEWDGVNYHDRKYHTIPRAYSGVQIFRKKAVEELIHKIEDDYIYRNEDLIFQAECIKQGFEYVKSPERHLHQILNSNWTSSWDKTHDMQWRGLVKYTEPSELTKSSCFPVLRERRDVINLTLSHCIFFGYENNPNWNKPIRDEWEKWGDEFDKRRGY